MGRILLQSDEPLLLQSDEYLLTQGDEGGTPPIGPAWKNAEPFDEVAWPDRMQIIRIRRSMIGGSEQKYYDGPPGDLSVCRARGRSVITADARPVTIWDVRTPVNHEINEGDMIHVVDPSGQLRKLVAEGPSVPRSEGYSYLTECMERK